MSTGSSDDESLIDIPPHHIKPYQFEPCKAESGSEDSSSSEENEEEEQRGLDCSWCTCGKCSATELKQKERVCCLEQPKMKQQAALDVTSGKHCITQHAEFSLLCENSVVLTNVLRSLNHVVNSNWETESPPNKALRWAAYRQLIWRVYNKLGRGRRVIIPACAVRAIRKKFPKSEEEEYTGYKSGFESDSD